MEQIKKNFGFGCMRLPMNGENIDTAETCRMVDAFLDADYYYNVVHTAPGRRASDCVKCGRCEKVCPQHLPIRRLPEDVAKEFEKEAN